MTEQEIEKMEEIDIAQITEKGIKYLKHRFVFKEMKEIEGKMKEVTVARLCEKYWCTVEGGRTYVSHQGPEHFMGVCFNRDPEKLKVQAEKLREFLMEYMTKERQYAQV